MTASTDPAGSPRTDRALPGLARHEILRQYDILWSERKQRMALTSLAFLLCAAYLPIWICALCAVVSVLAETASMNILGKINPETDRKTVWAVLSMVFAVEVIYTLPPGLIWQIEDPFARALSLGMIMITLIHLTTVRAIHLAQGVAGLCGVAAVVFAMNTLYWVKVDDWIGLLFSTVCAMGGLGYALVAMISNNQLHRATAEGSVAAQAADAAKSRFLAQMSHELRTPLNAIVGIGQTELRRTEDPKTRDRMDILVRAAEGLGIVLDDLLDMSAIQLGRLSIVKSDGSPRDLVTTTVGLFRLQADEAGLELDLILDPSLPARARFDQQRLRQCLSNLLSNALKYTPKGKVQVHAAVPAAQPSHLVVEVRDTGPGIPKGSERAIFEPFVRAEGQVAGTGLGLAISRALARGMGGDLQLIPMAPGQAGARFQLSIPLLPPKDPAPVAKTAVNVLSGRRVLVVDDLATNRLVATAMLEDLGATVLQASSGTDALDLLETEPVDMVFLDMNMPPPDGMKTFDRIRGLVGSNQSVPVLAMTAEAHETQRSLYRSAGLDGYVVKPLQVDALIEASAEALARLGG